MSVPKIALMAAVAWALSAVPGLSQTAVNSSFNVQITITASCQINSAGALNFGSNGVISANIDAQSTIAVQCTTGTPFNLGLGAGAGAGATVANRLMTGPASATVGYSLYTTAARSTVWGNTINTDTQAGTGTGAAQNFIVYGRVLPQTTPAAGTYNDTVAVTLTY